MSSNSGLDVKPDKSTSQSLGASAETNQSTSLALDANTRHFRYTEHVARDHLRQNTQSHKDRVIKFISG